MVNLTFADSHNMVAYLKKSTENADFTKIVDFLNANPIRPKNIGKQKKKAIEISQSSGPTTFVANETVHEEREDRVERTATTTTSLDTKQDSGTINKTQSTEIPNEPIPQGTGSSGSLRCQDTILGDMPAQNRVLALKNNKTDQDLEITLLKKRVKRLEKKKISRTPQLKRTLFKGRYGHDTEINTASTSITTASINNTTVEPVTTVNTPITTAGVSVSAAEPSTPSITTPTVIEDEVLTIAQTLIKMRSKKSNENAKEKGSKEKSSETATRPTKGVTMREAGETTTRPTVPPQQKVDLKDKGKDTMVEPEKPLKKKDQIEFDEEDDVQAMMDADHKLAETLQAEEQGELSIEERAEGSSKRAGKELEYDKSKNQKFDEKVESKVDNDREEAEMKMYMKMVSDDELVKAKYGNTRPEEAYEKVLWGDLKVMFEPEEETTRKQSDSLDAIFFMWSTFYEVSKSTYLYAGREKGRIIGIKRLLIAVEVTPASYEVTTAGYGLLLVTTDENILSYYYC
nr:hypothetical protein [Tanacetum cinerariifolium]